MRNLPAFLVGVLIGCALVPYAAHARWDSKEDDKSESTLEAMTQKDLFNEAFDVCVRRAMVERQGSDEPGVVTSTTEDASSYLEVISQVAGNDNKGVTPSWMRELTAAHTVKECQSAFRSFLTTQGPREAPVANKATPRVASKTATPYVASRVATPRATSKAATPRHGDPLEQLPPWLAPQQQ